MTAWFARLGVLAGLGLAATAVGHGQESAADRADLAVPMATARRATDAPPPMPPPLPDGADRISSLTLRTVVRKSAAGRAREVRQTITRSAERIHVVAPGGVEWLFERNPRDPRRVAGHYVEHAAKTIVYHSDSDLRTLMGIDGWARLLTLGFDPRSLDGMRPTGGMRTIAGLRFVRHAGGDEAVWWSSEALFPAELSRQAPGRPPRLVVESVSTTVDSAVLRAPSRRFPAYRAIDVAEWLEGH
jgi:hypothetical protein